MTSSTGLDRFGSLVVGPGLGRDPADLAAVRRVMAEAPLPVLLDGDGLAALARRSAATAPAAERPARAGDQPVPVARAGGWPAPRVLTPHDGEYRLLTGHPPGPDRLDAARSLAAAPGRRGAAQGADHRGRRARRPGAAGR